MNGARPRTPGPRALWLYGIPTLLALALAGAVGYLLLSYLPRERRESEAEVERDLMARAQLQSLAIEQWLEAGLRNAGTIASYPSVQALVRAASTAGDGLPRGAGETSAHMNAVLESFAVIQGYQNCLVFDARLRPLSWCAGRSAPAAADSQAARAVLAGQASVVLLGRYEGGRPDVVFARAVLAEGPGGSPLGVSIVHTDARAWLYPLLSAYHGDRASSEALLVAQEGDSTRFLSPPRLVPAASLRGRPLGGPGGVEREALLGANRFGAYRDYRGAAVFAVTRRLKTAPWGLVVKVDRSDALEDYTSLARRVALTWGLVSLAFAVLGAVAWRGQRREQEVELLRSRTRLALLLDQADDAILFFHEDGRIVEANRRAEEMHGLERGALVGRRVSELEADGPADGGAILRAADRAIVETRHRRADGTTFPIEASVRRLDLDQAPMRLAIVRDITERARADAQLRTMFRIVEQSPVSVVVTDTEGNIEYVNPRFCELTGYSAAEVVGRKPSILKSDRTSPEVYADLWRALRAGGEWRGEFCNRKKNGELYWEDAMIGPVRDAQGRITHLLAVKEDTTERKRTAQALAQSHEQLLQAQKMEAVGRLAGGVAHDFNNLLSVIRGYAEMLAQRAAPGSPDRGTLETILEASDRAAWLTRQLLAFGRKQVLEPRVLDVGELLANTVKIMRRLIGEDIELIVERPPALGRIRIDPGQLEQVVLNLAVNARDAMPGGGTLRFTLEDVEIRPQDLPEDAVLAPGRRVCMTVSDTGGGMSPEVQAHIFEPFFTTKERGRGSGLGLSTVYGIVRQSGGHIWVTSDPGHGTTFRICLPRVEQPLEAPAVMVPPPPGESGGHGELLLVVEDDDAVRSLTASVLEGGGYRVLAAADGGEALRMAEGRESRIALLLTDVILPGMNGRQVAGALRHLRPDLRVLFMSGYTDDVMVRSRGSDDDCPLEPGQRFLQKPFTVAMLLATVREVLQA
jgi:PAS domain S-box-containing protein